MNQSKNIKDPQTFGKHSANDTTQPDIKKESLAGISLSLLQHGGMDCPKGMMDGVYKCEICERLRRVCPYSNKKCKHNETLVKENNSTFMKSGQNTGIFESSTKWQQASFSRPKSYSHNGFNTAHFYTPPPIRKEPRIIEQIIYVPVIHNILVPQSVNPQSSPNKNESVYESPQFKHRHRSGTTKYPNSSPIKVQQYQPELIMTPEKLKQLTESMIA